MVCSSFWFAGWLGLSCALADDPPPTLPGAARGVPGLIQSRFGSKQMNFEVISPVVTGGLMHVWRDNDSGDLVWHGPIYFGGELGGVDAVSFIQSNYDSPGNLEIVAKAGDRIVYFWRDSGPEFRFRGPWTIASNAVGAPSLVQSRFGSKGNFELAVPSARGGIDLYWRDNDDPLMPWNGPYGVARDIGRVDEVSLIETNYDSPGNLEMMVRCGERLAYFWRDSGPQRSWRGPYFIAGGARGNPVLIQSSYGSKGNFELMVPSASGGIDFYWRNNDDARMPWAGPFKVLAQRERIDALTFIQSRFGSPGNLEVVFRVGDRLDFAFRDGLAWNGPFSFTAPMELPPPDGAHPPPALRKAYTQHFGNLITGRLIPGDDRHGPNDLTRWGFGGTDLGVSFEGSAGELIFLFGDSWMADRWDAPGLNDDTMAWTSDSSAGLWNIPRLTWTRRFTPLRVPNTSHGGMEVPVEGLTIGSRSEVFFVTDWDDFRKTYSHSVLAHCEGHDASHFTSDFKVATDRFLNVSAVVINDYVYVYGAGNPYRQSPVYLARVPVNQLTDPSKWNYYRGLRGGHPVFGPWESSAVALFGSPCVGELSVRRQPGTGLFLMTYNADWDGRRGYHLRTATVPWGPWSESELIFDTSSSDDPGYGVTMHRQVNDRTLNGKFVGGAHYDDGLTECGHPDGDGYGGEYAPYMIPRYSRPLGNGVHSLVYTHSKWHPYKVSLLETVLVEPGARAERPRRGTDLRPVIPALDRWVGTGAPFVFFDHLGARWISTYNASAGGDNVMGAIWYDLTFDAAASELHFFVHGGHGAVKLFHNGEVVRETRGPETNDFDREVRWFISEFRGETTRIVIEDTVTNPWGFISVSPIELR
jgi:hypothetical protein